MWKTPLF